MSSQKIRIRLKGYDHEVVDQSAKLIVDTAQKTGARVSGPIPLPTERNLYTVIRSPHKDKDSREQFPGWRGHRDQALSPNAQGGAPVVPRKSARASRSELLLGNGGGSTRIQP